MKRFIKVLIVLLIFWVGITCYFVAQHSVVGKVAKINKTLVFDDVTVELESLGLYNFKRKMVIFDPEESEKFKYKILANLPPPLVMPYLKIMYLYSRPYEIDNKLYQTALFGRCVFKEQTMENIVNHEYFVNHLRIDVKDSVGYGYSSSHSSQYEDDKSKEMDISIRGRDFPIERLQNGIKVIIKHMESGEVREIEVDFEDFVDYKHNDSIRKPFPFKYKIT